jgi:hypothetical protein
MSMISRDNHEDVDVFLRALEYDAELMEKIDFPDLEKDCKSFVAAMNKKYEKLGLVIGVEVNARGNPIFFFAGHGSGFGIDGY